MYLHENIDLFRDVISATSEDQGDKDFAIIEKDYYVTMILKLLAEEATVFYPYVMTQFSTLALVPSGW